MIKDAIADITLQQVLTRPEDFDVIATLNLNGDYLSDALAAQVGGIGIAPGGNINYITGHAVFEATHGTAPKYANQDKVNPGSVVLSGEMMFRYMGWKEVADLIIKGLNGAIASKRVTYDFARLMERCDRDQVLRVRPEYHRPHVSSSPLWSRFQEYFVAYDDVGFSLDVSRMRFADDFFAKMQPRVDQAFAAMAALEAGAIANPDEQRMVGHYWLRAPELAPNEQLRRDVTETNRLIKEFAAPRSRRKTFSESAPDWNRRLGPRSAICRSFARGRGCSGADLLLR